MRIPNLKGGIQKSSPFFRSWPFSLVYPTIFLTVLTSGAIFALFLIVNLIAAIPPWVSFIFSGIYYIHMLGLIVSFSFEAYQYEDPF